MKNTTQCPSCSGTGARIVERPMEIYQGRPTRFYEGRCCRCDGTGQVEIVRDGKMAASGPEAA